MSAKTTKMSPKNTKQISKRFATSQNKSTIKNSQWSTNHKRYCLQAKGNKIQNKKTISFTTMIFYIKNIDTTTTKPVYHHNLQQVENILYIFFYCCFFKTTAICHQMGKNDVSSSLSINRIVLVLLLFIYNKKMIFEDT